MANCTILCYDNKPNNSLQKADIILEIDLPNFQKFAQGRGIAQVL